MLKTRLLTIALLAACQSALAQQPPTSGGQIQGIPAAPMPDRPAPAITVPPDRAPAYDPNANVTMRVEALRVTGQEKYSEAELVALTGFTPGMDLSIVDLRAMAKKIADRYHAAGYFVAQAYLPQQDIKDGVVNIVVLEGRYGNVTLKNQSKLSDGVANGLLDGVNGGDPIAVAPLERDLMLLSDLPGVNVRSTLVPGATAGASDLIVEVTPGKSISGNVEADNAGNRYTGEYRVGGTVNFNNPTGHGDVISVRGLTSGSGLNYGRLSYQTQLGKARAGVAYTAMAYELSREFESLRAHGTVRIASIFGSYPLIRSRNNNLSALLQYDDKTFKDYIDSTASVTDKTVNSWTGGLQGNHHDGLGGGGVTSYSLMWTAGDLDIRTPSALATDAATAKSNGSYVKTAYYAARLQRVTDRVALYGAINGQFASKNLDISEKMGLGGMYGVRAYPSGEAYGDEGYIVNLEARLLMPTWAPRQVGNVHLIGFIDTGSVTLHRTPWVGGINSRNLDSAGVGITWVKYNDFELKAYWAHKLGSEPATSAPDESSRIWVQGVKYF
jgi:hemolysin activation/secretion protein